MLLYSLLVLSLSRFSTYETIINEQMVKAAKNMGGHIIKPVNQASPLVRHVAQTAGEIKQVYSRASILSDGLVKNAHFSYQNRTVLLNTQPFLNWTLLLQKVKEYFQIAQNLVVNIYEKLDDGTLSQIQHKAELAAQKLQQETEYRQQVICKLMIVMEKFAIDGKMEIHASE